MKIKEPRRMGTLWYHLFPPLSQVSVIISPFCWRIAIAEIRGPFIMTPSMRACPPMDVFLISFLQEFSDK